MYFVATCGKSIKNKLNYIGELMMISVYYKKKTSLNGYLCDMDTARKHGRTFSVLCDLQYPYSFCNISNYYSNDLI
ncbi:hypothetical protein C5Z00_15600 [Bacteroides caccae]|nr:hypothetical protein C5Z00_15600 [Bacteroides caccae]